MRWMHNEILCLLYFCRPGFLTIHIPPWSSTGSQVLRICRSQRLDMGLKRVSWVRRYQGQCRALRPLGHQGCRLRSCKKDPPLCSGYTTVPRGHPEGHHIRPFPMQHGVNKAPTHTGNHRYESAGHNQGRGRAPKEADMDVFAKPNPKHILFYDVIGSQNAVGALSQKPPRSRFSGPPQPVLADFVIFVAIWCAVKTI